MSVQQIFRTLAFVAETIVFAYLGLAIFSFKHRTEPALIGWVLVLCLVGRAVNIFPLSFILNYFRDIKITKKNQVVMWFSGLRGAIAFALVLHMDGISEETSQVLVTTTLIVVLCSIIFLGGLTLPFMKFITWFTACSANESESEDELYVSPTILKLRNRRLSKLSNHSQSSSVVNGSASCLLKKSRSYRRNRKSSQSSTHEVFISKTKEMGDALDSENNMSGYYDTDMEHFDRHCRQKSARRKNQHDIKLKELSKIDSDNYVTTMGEVAPTLRGFMRFDAKYFYPFFTRCHSEKEVLEARKSMNTLTDQWSKIVRVDKPDIEEELETTTSKMPQPHDGDGN